MEGSAERLEDDELAKELDSMREFLAESQGAEEEESFPTWASSSAEAAFAGEDVEFAAAAAAAAPAARVSASREEEEEVDELALLGGRRRPGLSRSAYESASSGGEEEGSRFEELESPARLEETELPSRRAREDDVSYAAGFLDGTPRPVGSRRTTAAMAGLYESSEEPEAKPTPLQVEDEGTALTYKEFLARLVQPKSAELVSHVRAFVVRALDDFRGAEDAVRARQPGAARKRRDLLEALPERCAKFFDAAEAYLERREEWRRLGHAGLASSRAALEKYVMTKLAALAFEASRNDEMDARLRARCRALATFVTPEHLDVKPSLCNEVVVDIARDELRRMDSCKAPADKVDCVVKCASIIFSALNLSRADNSSKNGGVSESRAGADDFLPVFIYVVLRADAPRLVSNCDYINAFHNPAALISKAGYCFVNLRSAVDFLLHLRGSQIGLDDATFHLNLQQAHAALGLTPEETETPVPASPPRSPPPRRLDPAASPS